MGDIYYSPEKFGLEVVGAIDWSDGCYQFDMTVVWQKKDTLDKSNMFYWGEDAGCSCPSPFEDKGIDDLQHGDFFEAEQHIQNMIATAREYAYDPDLKVDGEEHAVALIARMRGLSR